MRGLYGVEIHLLVKKTLKHCGALHYLKDDEIKEMIIPLYSKKSFLERVLQDYPNHVPFRRYLKQKIAEDVAHFARLINSEDTLYRRVKAYCSAQPKNASKNLILSPISMRHLYQEYQQLTLEFQNLGIFKDWFFDAYICSKMSGNFIAILSNILKQNKLYHEDFEKSIDSSMTEKHIECYLVNAYTVASKLIVNQIPFHPYRVGELLKICRDEVFLNVFSNYVVVCLAIEAKGSETIPRINYGSHEKYLSDLKVRLSQCPLHLKEKKRTSYLDTLFKLHPIMPEAYCLSYQYGVEDRERDAWIMAHINLIVHHMQMNIDRFEMREAYENTPSVSYLDAFLHSYNE